MAFRVGQKVVCVDATGQCILKRGEVYTVCGFNHSPGILFLQLEELPHGPGNGWYANRFRPVTDKPTSIEIFHRILDEASKKSPRRKKVEA